jgi:hypothetical protein
MEPDAIGDLKNIAFEVARDSKCNTQPSNDTGEGDDQQPLFQRHGDGLA